MTSHLIFPRRSSSSFCFRAGEWYEMDRATASSIRPETAVNRNTENQQTAADNLMIEQVNETTQRSNLE